MVETLGALSGAFGSGHRHLPQAEATGGFRPGSPSGNGGADGNSSLLSIRSETDKNGEQIALPCHGIAGHLKLPEVISGYLKSPFVSSGLVR